VELRTHLKIDRELCGEPTLIREGKAKVLLKTNGKMVADEKGLIHGGFIFGAADYCAMVAVNHPNVVLGSAQVRFLKPVKLGEEIEFEGEVFKEEGKKKAVKVVGKRNGEEVFKGEFTCFVLEKHVLERT